MKNINYVNLHIHTNDSILDSPSTIEEYAIKIKNKLSQNYFAITEHGNINSIIQLYNVCKKYGITPIPGMEAYVYDPDLEPININEIKDIETKKKYRKKYHLILLAKNKIGFQNILKINNLSVSDERYYYNPTVFLEDIFKHSEGLIILSSCINSVLSKYIFENNEKTISNLVEKLKEYTNNSFFMEIQIINLKRQKEYNARIIEIAKKHNIKVVFTNDAHFVEKQDYIYRNFLQMVKNRTTATVNDKGNVNEEEYCLEDNYIKEVAEIFNSNIELGYNYDEKQLLEFLDNTNYVASTVEQINFFQNFSNFLKYEMTEEEKKMFNCKNNEELLIKYIMKNLKEKIEKKIIPYKNYSISDYLQRIKYEVDVLKKCNYIDYFLVINDIINYCKKNNIYTDFGRGSVGGSLVAYILGITNCDSLRWGTFFERFVSTDRKEKDFPDIDLDFDAERRDEVLEYVKKRFNVIKIGIKQRFGIKNILRDYARIFFENDKEKLNIIDYICKNLSNNATLEELEEFLKDDKNNIKEKIDYKKIKYFLKKIYGKIRSFGSHPAGVAIINKDQLIPLYRYSGDIVTGIVEGETRELSEWGVLKIDILGLKNITLIAKTIDMIEEKYGKEEKEIIKNIIDTLPDEIINQKDLYKPLQQDDADTIGIFMFDTDLGKSLIEKVKPNKFMDIVDLNALNRPDIIKSGQTQKYIEIRNNKKYNFKEDILYNDEILREITKKTNYCILYQEQVMQILHNYFGFTMAEANLARKYISKKQREKFIDLLNDKVNELISINSNVLKEKKFSKENIEKLVNIFLNFGSYSFNFSHSVEFSLLSFLSLFLREIYPQQFFTSLMNIYSDDKDYLQNIYISIIKRNRKNMNMNSMNSLSGIIKILPVDLYKSDFEAKVEDNNIRLGFKFLKNFSERAYKEILKVKNLNKKIETIVDFLNLDLNWEFVNKQIIEKMVLSGIFDYINPNRKFLYNFVKNYKSKIQKRDISKNDILSLFSFYSQDQLQNNNTKKINNNVLTDVIDFSLKEKIEIEYKNYGFYFNEYINIFEKDEKIKKLIENLKEKNLISNFEQLSLNLDFRNKFFVLLVLDVEKKKNRMELLVSDNYGLIKKIYYYNNLNNNNVKIEKYNVYLFSLQKNNIVSKIEEIQNFL